MKKIKSFKIFNFQSWHEQVVTILLLLNFLRIIYIETWLDFQLGSIEKVCYDACRDPDRLCPTVSLWHLAFDQLKSSEGTTVCALEDSALPGALVCNQHLPKQPGYSLSLIYPTFPLYCLACFSRTGHLH